MEQAQLKRLKETYAEILFLIELYEKAGCISKESEFDEKAKLMESLRDKILKATFCAKEIIEGLENV